MRKKDPGPHLKGLAVPFFIDQRTGKRVVPQQLVHFDGFGCRLIRRQAVMKILHFLHGVRGKELRCQCRLLHGAFGTQRVIRVFCREFL